MIYCVFVISGTPFATSPKKYTMSKYMQSNGLYIKKSILDRKTREAKAVVLENQRDDIGYNVCITCERNDCKPVTCAHLISVDECQKTGRAELAWDIENIIPEGLPCHQKRDKLFLGNA